MNARTSALRQRRAAVFGLTAVGGSTALGQGAPSAQIPAGQFALVHADTVAGFVSGALALEKPGLTLGRAHLGGQDIRHWSPRSPYSRFVDAVRKGVQDARHDPATVGECPVARLSVVQVEFNTGVHRE